MCNNQSLENVVSTLTVRMQRTLHMNKYALDVQHEQILDTPMPVAWNLGRFVDCKPNSPLHLRIGFDDVEESEGDIPCKRIPLFIVTTLTAVTAVLLYPRCVSWTCRLFIWSFSIRGAYLGRVVCSFGLSSPVVCILDPPSVQSFFLCPQCRLFSRSSSIRGAYLGPAVCSL